jgi:cellulose synthase (UDP-forming)
MIAAFAVPHLVQSIATSNRIQGQDRRAFWGEVYESLLAFHLVVPTIATLLNPKRGKFNVTDKGGLLDKGYFDAGLMWPHMAVVGLLVLGLAAGVAKLLVGGFGVDLGTLLLNASWTLFSLLILSTALAVGRETRQMRAYVRVGARLPVILKFGDGREVRAVTDEISMGGFAVSKVGPVNTNQSIDVQLLCGAQWTAFPRADRLGDGRDPQDPVQAHAHRPASRAGGGGHGARRRLAAAWRAAVGQSDRLADRPDAGQRLAGVLVERQAARALRPAPRCPQRRGRQVDGLVLCALLACLALFAARRRPPGPSPRRPDPGTGPAVAAPLAAAFARSRSPWPTWACGVRSDCWASTARPASL